MEHQCVPKQKCLHVGRRRAQGECTEQIQLFFLNVSYTTLYKKAPQKVGLKSTQKQLICSWLCNGRRMWLDVWNYVNHSLSLGGHRAGLACLGSTPESWAVRAEELRTGEASLYGRTVTSLFGGLQQRENCLGSAQCYFHQMAMRSEASSVQHKMK